MVKVTQAHRLEWRERATYRWPVGIARRSVSPRWYAHQRSGPRDRNSLPSS